LCSSPVWVEGGRERRWKSKRRDGVETKSSLRTRPRGLGPLSTAGRGPQNWEGPATSAPSAPSSRSAPSAPSSRSAPSASCVGGPQGSRRPRKGNPSGGGGRKEVRTDGRQVGRTSGKRWNRRCIRRRRSHPGGLADRPNAREHELTQGCPHQDHSLSLHYNDESLSLIRYLRL